MFPFQPMGCVFNAPRMGGHITLRNLPLKGTVTADHHLYFSWHHSLLLWRPL